MIKKLEIVHYYNLETTIPTYGSSNAYVAVCDPHLFEQSHRLFGPPGEFYFGTTDPQKVTCKNCLQTKKYKQALVGGR